MASSMEFLVESRMPICTDSDCYSRVDLRQSQSASQVELSDPANDNDFGIICKLLLLKFHFAANIKENTLF